MFSNLKKKVSQRRQQQQNASSLSPPPTPTKGDDTATEIAATASESTSSLRLPTLQTTSMKIHIQIKFRPAWNINDTILKCLQQQHVDVLLHKSTPIDKEWHQNDLYGKVQLPTSSTEAMSQAQHMESLKREIQVALNQPEAIVTLKQWEPRRRRQKMQSTPAGVGSGLGLFGEPLNTSTQSKTTKQQWTPAKIILQDQDGNPIAYNVRLSPQSIQDLQQQNTGNMHDYHGMPVRHNSQPICLLTAQVINGEEGMNDVATNNSHNATVDLSHVDQHHRRLHGIVRKQPSM